MKKQQLLVDLEDPSRAFFFFFFFFPVWPHGGLRCLCLHFQATPGVLSSSLVPADTWADSQSHVTSSQTLCNKVSFQMIVIRQLT